MVEIYSCNLIRLNTTCYFIFTKLPLNFSYLFLLVKKWLLGQIQPVAQPKSNVGNIYRGGRGSCAGFNNHIYNTDNMHAVSLLKVIQTTELGCHEVIKEDMLKLSQVSFHFNCRCLPKKNQILIFIVKLLHCFLYFFHV